MCICIAPRREHTSKALRYGTRSQGISQFYLHTPRSSANGMNHTCLCLPSRSWYSFTDPVGMEGWVGLGSFPKSEQSTCNKAIQDNISTCGQLSLYFISEYEMAWYGSSVSHDIAVVSGVVMFVDRRWMRLRQSATVLRSSTRLQSWSKYGVEIIFVTC